MDGHTQPQLPAPRSGKETRAVTSLFTAVFAAVPTRRRRFFWAAWWSAAPRAEPFQKPDASSGGAGSREEARAAAERAAGRGLVEIEPRWAGAWVRVLRGDPPWPAPRDSGAAREANAPPAPPAPAGTKPWARSVLGLGAAASTDDVKRAFRSIALRTHPDRGGAQADFIDAKRAYDVLCAAIERPRRKRRR
jgi:hypothetical protein